MTNWYVLAVITLLFFGIQRFLYKVSAEKRCNSAWTSFSFMGTVALLSSILFFASKETLTNLFFLLCISFVNSASFLANTITAMEALKRISMSVVYPVIRLNTTVVVIFSIIYFRDRLSIYQILGIILAIIVILILIRYDYEEQRVRDKNVKVGFILIFLALLSGVVAAISTKFAAIYTNTLGFMAISYIFSTFFSLGLRKRLKSEQENSNHRNALIIGCSMGLANFIGFYAFLKALSMGPLSIIISISGMYFVIAIVLSALIYREKLNRLRIAGICLTIIAVTLMRV